ncbi:hypothetical protein CRUP_028975 [Coryphaenoides rupestris]|nr:hypothetical protein CRUP_028975 [Coryphaenoides rupestris]
MVLVINVMASQGAPEAAEMLQKGSRRGKLSVGPPEREEGGLAERGQWASKAEFILAVAGQIVGLGNVWRFPYLCYKNGGGVFFVPYLLFLVLPDPAALVPLQQHLEHRRGVLKMSSSLDELGPINWELALCHAAVWIICYFCIWKGVKSTGKVVYLTATFPYLMLFALLKGPDSFVLCLLNGATSFVAGFAIFSVLGFMAQEQGVDIAHVAQSGPERFSDNIREMIGYRPPRFFNICWRYLTPLLCITTFISALARFTPLTLAKGLVPPAWALGLSWLVTSSVCLIPIWALYALANTPGPLLQVGNELILGR